MRPALGQLGGDLQQRQPTAHVAVGGLRDQRERGWLDAQVHRAQPALAVAERALERGDDVATDTDSSTCTRQRESNAEFQLERGVLGGGAHEQDRAALDVRQEGVLLGLVETMHLVDEQHRAPPLLEARLRLRQYQPHLRQPGEHRGDGAELGIGVLGEQQRQRGLAAARRPPQDHRVHVPGFDRASQRGAGASRRCWPTISSSVRGRMRSARGLSASGGWNSESPAAGACLGPDLRISRAAA
jgi:hypothetical protein